MTDKKLDTQDNAPEQKTGLQKMKNRCADIWHIAVDASIPVLGTIFVYNSTPALQTIGLVKGAMASAGIFATSVTAGFLGILGGGVAGNYIAKPINKIVDKLKGANAKRTKSVEGRSIMLGALAGGVLSVVGTVNGLEAFATDVINDNKETSTLHEKTAEPTKVDTLTIKSASNEAFAYPSQADALKPQTPKLTTKPMMRMVG